MRGQGRTNLSPGQLLAFVLAAFAGTMVFVIGAVSQEIVPRLTGNRAPMEDAATPPMAKPIMDDVRRMRAYPEQPPVIPHSIDGYELSLGANRCLECHRRQFAERVSAPMISVTHFVDRDGQVLADVAPRRYFCTQCHVQQTDARALVPNVFVDMSTMQPVEDE
jgi:nitrate reductase (cytochrome), electron transfer subunit